MGCFLFQDKSQISSTDGCRLKRFSRCECRCEIGVVFQKWQDRQRQQTASKTRHATPAWQSQLVARSLVSGKATNTTYYYRAEHRSSSWRRRSPCRNFHLTSSGVVTIWTVEIHRGKQRRKRRAAPTACTVCFFWVGGASWELLQLVVETSLNQSVHAKWSLPCGPTI